MSNVPAVKDPNGQHPVPTDWRRSFEAIVRAFASGDFELKKGIRYLEPIDAKVAQNAKAYVINYGETLVELPEETWKTSATQWTSGYWDVLVDLWTVESGRSDLVLSARVFEDGDQFRIKVFGVYVP